MNSSDNIFNAFEVVNKTHENVNKLMNYCKNIVNEKGGYVLASPKFLRWKSDGNYAGWNTNSFILLFQDSNDQELDNKWRSGPVYVLEIDLYNLEAYDKPMVVIAKFEYENIASWTEGCSPANHYIFHDPLCSGNYKEIESKLLIAEMDENFRQRYWGLNRVICKEVPLIDITGENAHAVIFGGFDKLKEN